MQLCFLLRNTIIIILGPHGVIIPAVIGTDTETGASTDILAEAFHTGLNKDKDWATDTPWQHPGSGPSSLFCTISCNPFIPLCLNPSYSVNTPFRPIPRDLHQKTQNL